MSHTPKTPISATLIFNATTGKVIPGAVLYNNKKHIIEKLGFHHYFRSGKTLYHIFSVTSGTLFFKLSFNTDNLNWTLEEVYDAELDE